MRFRSFIAGAVLLGVALAIGFLLWEADQVALPLSERYSPSLLERLKFVGAAVWVALPFWIGLCFLEWVACRLLKRRFGRVHALTAALLAVYLAGYIIRVLVPQWS